MAKNLNALLSEYVGNMLKYNSVQYLKACVDQWYGYCSRNFKYRDHTGNYVLFDIENICNMERREDVYTELMNIIDIYSKRNNYAIVIPDNCGYYRTLCISANGELIISDKSYTDLNVLKRHNSMVPGGITVEELKKSRLSWCLQFLEELNE